MSEENAESAHPEDHVEAAAEEHFGENFAAGLASIERQLTELSTSVNSHSETLQAVSKRGDSIANMLSRVTQSQNLAAGQIRKFAERVDEQANAASQGAFRRFLIDLLRYYDLLQRHSDSAAERDGTQQLLLMLRQQMDQLLASHQIEAFAPDTGALLDTDSGEHEAIQEQHTDSPQGHQKIVEVLRQGFRAENHILRPAQVVVAVYRPTDSSVCSGESGSGESGSGESGSGESGSTGTNSTETVSTETGSTETGSAQTVSSSISSSETARANDTPDGKGSPEQQNEP